jgi:DNA-binding NtrC family response regulator
MASPVTIYVVDDEPVIASTLAAILNASGFQATAFTDPETALETSKSVKPSLLLTDVVMPEMNGIDLAIQFKSVCPDCKVLLFSGQAATSDLMDSASIAGHDFELLAKPVHPTDLLAAIRNL